MAKFYTSATDQIHHADGSLMVKNIVSVLSQCANDPISLLSRTTDFFGDALDTSDECLRCLRTYPSDPVLQQRLTEMLSTCLHAVIAVLERQYAEDLQIAVTGEYRKETESARSHNIDAEEVMGMFSSAKQRAPSATLCFISAWIRAKKNRTVDYLDGMDPEKRDKVVRWSIGKGRKRRSVNRAKVG